MRVVYSDEAGAGEIDSDPVAIVTAILMNMDKHWGKVEAELSAIVADVPDALLEVHVAGKEQRVVARELKGKILYRAIRKGDPKAKEILERILAVTYNHSVPIYYGSVDRKGYDDYATKRGNKDDPKLATALGAAFDACLARVALMVTADLEDDEQILWIADRADKQKEAQTKGGLTWTRFLHDSGHDLITLARKEIRRDKPLRIADTIYFGHSHESLALQLADVCCSTIRLKILEDFYGWRPIVEPFYEIIGSQVMNSGERPKFLDPVKLSKE